MGSGQRQPEVGHAEDLIDRERDQAEHEVAFDLDGAAHADEPRAEFILQSGVDSFDHSSKIKEGSRFKSALASPSILIF